MTQKKIDPLTEVKPGDIIQEPSRDDVINSLLAKMQPPAHNVLDVLDETTYKKLWRVAQTIAGSNIIPEAYHRQPHSVFTAFIYAKNIHRDVFWVMNNTYIVHGAFNFWGKAIRNLLNGCGLFEQPRPTVTFFGEGEDRGAKMNATFKDSGEEIEATFTYKQAVALNWVEQAKKGGFFYWDHMRDQKILFALSKRFCDMWCPEILGGVDTEEENNMYNNLDLEIPKAPLFPEKAIDPKPKVEEKQASQTVPDNASGKIDKKEKSQKAIFENPEKLAKIVTENRDTFPNSDNIKVAENETLKPDKTGTVRNIDTENNLELPKAVSEALGTIIKTLHASQIKTEHFELYISSEMPAMLDKGATLNNISTKNLLALSKDLVSCISQYRAWEKEKATSKK